MPVASAYITVTQTLCLALDVGMTQNADCRLRAPKRMHVQREPAQVPTCGDVGSWGPAAPPQCEVPAVTQAHSFDLSTRPSLPLAAIMACKRKRACTGTRVRRRLIEDWYERQSVSFEDKHSVSLQAMD